MKLHYKITGSGQPLIILHGLLGSLSNWRAVADVLSDYAQVITVDLRNHGQSPHSTEQTYSLMVDDLAELMADLSLQSVDMIGHSIGGKVAMAFVETFPQKVRKLMVVDIAPRQYQSSHCQIFNALLGLDLSSFTTRKEVDSALAVKLPDKAVRQFLLMNLAVSGQQLTWQINLQALADNYVHLLEAVCQKDKVSIPSYFIKGGRSDYIQKNDEDEIRTIFSNVVIDTIDSAGHWVHAESPQEFMTKAIHFFNYD